MSKDIERNRTEDRLIEAAGAYIDRFASFDDLLLSRPLRALRQAVREYRAARRSVPEAA